MRNPYSIGLLFELSKPGCGGAVLRWLNPRRAIPVTMWLYTAVAGDFYIDGAEPPSATPLLAPGRHVIGIHLPEADLAFGLLLFAAFTTGKEIRVKRSGAPIPDFRTLSVADGSWKYTTAKPGDHWNQSDFDDSPWAPMIEKELLKPAKDDWSTSYRYKRVAETGARGLGIELRVRISWTRKKEVWVRKALVIPEPESR